MVRATVLPKEDLTSVPALQLIIDTLMVVGSLVAFNVSGMRWMRNREDICM
jgi:hypothetical protein